MRSKLQLSLILLLTLTLGCGDDPAANQPNGQTDGQTDGQPDGKPDGKPDGEPDGERTPPADALADLPTILDGLGEAIIRGDVAAVAARSEGEPEPALANARVVVHSLRGMYLSGQLRARYGDDATRLDDELRRFHETSLDLSGKLALDPRRLATDGTRVEQEPWGPTRYKIQHRTGAWGARVSLGWSPEGMPASRTLTYVFGPAKDGFPIRPDQTYAREVEHRRAAKLLPGLRALERIAKGLEAMETIEQLESALAALPAE